ncbi:MAG: hypothetical protein OXN26_09825 [Gammaproteobacteria bacterium]|nr:hypothetical protein [Gammaproteobacteria bacterium]
MSGSTTYAQDTEVTVSVGSGTATAGADFSPVQDFSITIAGGASSGSAHFAFSPINDDDSEGDETVAITGAAGAIKVTATAVTIEDDEAPVRQVVLSASDVAVDEGASASWNVKLSAVPDGAVVVTISGHAGTDLSLDTTRLEFDETNWNSARPVTVSAGEDDDTADDTATLAHAASGGGYDSAAASLRVATADNDTAAIVLKPGSLELIEGRSESYEVTLAAEPSGDVAVAISGHAGTYLRLDKSNLVFTASDWNIPQTVTVTAEDDGSDGEPMREARTLTHAGSGGGYDGVEAELGIDVLLNPIVIMIDDAQGPEGSYLEFRVHLSKPSPGDVEVSWGTHAEVAQSRRDFMPDEGRLRFAEGEQEKIISVWAEEDDVDDPNEIFTVELWYPAGAVLDDPVRAVPASHTHDTRVGVAVEIMRAIGTIVGPAPEPLELSIGASEPFVDEGGTMRVTVTATASNELERAIRVPLVYANGTAEDGDFEGEPGLWIYTGLSHGTADITALHDEDEDDETFTVSIGELRPLEAVAGSDASIELTILDDDGAGGVEGLSVSVEDAAAEEGKENLRFLVRLSQPADIPVTVWAETRAGSASVDQDYIHGSGEVRFEPGQRTQTFIVWVHDDDIDEGVETLTLELSDPDPADVTIARATATGTIRNSDPIPGAWLGRFGRTLAQQTVDSVADRMQARREPGFEGSVPLIGLSVEARSGGDANDTEEAPATDDPGADAAGTAVAPGAAGEPMGHEMPGTPARDGAFGHAAPGPGPSQFDTESGYGGPLGGYRDETVIYTFGEFLMQALAGASFTRTGEVDPAGGTLAWWGRGASSQFSGSDGMVDLDGDIATGTLGADYARGGWLAGASLAHSYGRGNWSGAAADGELEASLTSLTPYAAYSVSERLQAWGAAGKGWGTLKLEHGTDEEGAERLKTDLGWSMAAAGVRGDLLGSSGDEEAGPGLSLVADALWTDTSSGRTEGLVAARAAVTRLRLGLEGSWTAALDGGGSLTPTLELGARHDGGDAETGFGVDLGGGLAWADPARGLALDIQGRTLIAHEDGDIRDWGVSASFAWHARPDPARGLSLKLGQELGGQAGGGVAALFAPDAPGNRAGVSGGNRRTSELAYGFPVFNGRFLAAPRMSYGSSGAAREYGFGWRMEPTKYGPDLSLDILSTRREGGLEAPEHGIRIEMNARW